MKSTMVGREGNEVTFKMDFEAAEFEKAIDEVYRANKHRYSIDGFRKGKAPRKLIESRFGADVFYEDAVNEMFSTAYMIALSELNIEPVDNPSAEFGAIEAGKDLEATVKVTVVPEVNIKEYKGVKIKKVDDSVSDEDVDKDLKNTQKRNARMLVSEGPAKEGDTIILDYAGFVGDNQFEGGTAEGQPLTLGSNTFIPGFEDQLIGVKTGEERDVKVTFPEEYHAEDLAGKEAVFKCKVHEIKETELPELNDDFAQDVSEFDTLDEYKADIRSRLEKAAREKAEYEMKNAVLEAIYESTEVDVPDVMVENHIDEMVQEFAGQLKQSGLALEQYLEYLDKSLADFREEMRKDAFKKAKTKLLVDAIIKAENIDADEDEIESELRKMAAMYGMENDKLREMMGLRGMAMLRQDVKSRKAIDLIYDNAVIE